MLRIISIAYILGGGVFMSAAGVKYSRLLKKMRDGPKGGTLRTDVVGQATELVFLFFILIFFVGAFEIISRSVNPIFLFVWPTFFAASIFTYLVVQNIEWWSQNLKDQNSRLEQALEKKEGQNRELLAEVHSNVSEIIHQDELLRAANKIASILLASTSDHFDASLMECIGMLADNVDADRGYVWCNYEEDGLLYCRQRYEWSGNVEPQQGTEYTADICYDRSIPHWRDTLAVGFSVNGPVRNLSESEQRFLVPQGIASILIVPVMLNDRFWGVVGFDDCRQERTFSDTEEGVLRSASLLIATAIQRNETIQNLVVARELALSSARVKSAFLSNMSHEIRTPINAITGMTLIAGKTDDIGRIRDCLTKIDVASRQLLGLINDILDMSKIEAGKMELLYEHFDIVKTFENLRSIIGVRAAEKNQQLSVRISPDVPRVVVGDEMRLSQILINLLSNSVKFTPEQGEIELSLSVAEAFEGGFVFEASVCDNGIGITPEQRERLFLAFEQAERSTVRKFGGTGLGLAISRRIAQLMDGGISVESEPGKGSKFCVHFIMQAGNECLLAKAQDTVDFGGHDFSAYTALLVEDIDINREIVLSLLEESGIRIDCAVNGEEAVGRFAENPDHYDVILMDIHMPIMDGYDAARIIRGLPAARARTVPIVAMTANAFAEDVAKCISAGMNDHIAKPIDVEKLYRVIERYASEAATTPSRVCS